MTGRRLLLTVAVVGLVAVAGCSSIGGGDPTTTGTDPATTATAPTTDGGTDPGSDGPDGSDATTGSAGTAGSDAGADGETAERTTDDGDGDEDVEPADGGSPEVAPSEFPARTVSDEAVAETRRVEEYRAVWNRTKTVVSDDGGPPVEADQVSWVDRSAERFELSLTRSSGNTSRHSDVVLVDETLFFRTGGDDGEWTSSGTDRAAGVFARNDLLAPIRRSLDGASVSAVGEATVDGTEVYVLDAEFAPEDFPADRLLTGPVDATTVRNATGTYYVATDTSRIERVSLTVDWTIGSGDATTNLSTEVVATVDYPSVSVTRPGAGGDDDATTPDDDGTGDAPEAVVGASEPVAVEGDLPVNATRVYQRVERLMNVSDAAPTVRVVEADDPVVGVRRDPTARALRFGNATGDVGRCGPVAAATTVGDEVRVDPGNLSAETLEVVLAHEFVHTLQAQVDGIESPRRALSRENGLALVEGSAVYVADVYAQRYDASWAGDAPLDFRECFYRRSENAVRRLAGQYYYGGRYFEDRVDSPAALSEVFTAPPRTTEQLVHGETPASEPPVPLSVTTPGWERGDGYQRTGGELLVRAWLSTALDQSRVDAAATGWGNDRLLVSVAADRRSGVAWVLRWDTGDDADQFAAAVADLEPVLESRDATDVRSVRVSSETVVVFVGPGPWVADATATGSDGNVTVSVP